MPLTGYAPAIWGSTDLVTSLVLADWQPMTRALLRALPAGALLMMMVRQWPHGHWWGRAILLGAFNFTLFWWLLFIAAQRLPGGVGRRLAQSSRLSCCCWRGARLARHGARLRC